MYLSLVSLWLSYIEQQCHGSDTTRNFRCILWIQYIMAKTCRLSMTDWLFWSKYNTSLLHYYFNSHYVPLRSAMRDPRIAIFLQRFSLIQRWISAPSSGRTRDVAMYCWKTFASVFTGFYRNQDEFFGIF